MRAVASQAGGATPAKQSWLPGTPIPPYLEDLPAAYGFDPLRLGSNSGALRWCALPKPKPKSEDLPAAYGFDPLRLGSNSGALRWCALPKPKPKPKPALPAAFPLQHTQAGARVSYAFAAECEPCTARRVAIGAVRC